MKKLIFLLVVMISIILAACGPNGESPQTALATAYAHLTQIAPTETPSPTRTLTPTRTTTATNTPVPTPGYSEILIIGYTAEGRPLEVFRFGNGEHSLMIVAGIHGGYEWNTVSLADQLIEKLTNDPNLVPADKTLYILRLLNPDGYEKDKGPDGRANSNNVDLNRNWDANWQANWWGSHCWSYRFITAGSAPGSELETQALANFLLEKHVEAIISYHSAGLGIFPGGWPYDKQSLKFAFSISQVSPYPYPPVETDCMYTGQLADWASKHGIAAVDIELTNHVDTDLAINLQILNVFLDWGN
jgi:predicted deacylase